MKRIQIITSVLIIVIFSCYKQLPKPGSNTYPYYPIPQTLKDYIEFKPGTYWIYEDSATGKIDSQYVTHYTNGIDTIYMPENTGIYEWYNLYVNSTIDTSSSIYTLYMEYSYNGDFQMGNQNWHYVNNTTMRSYTAAVLFIIYPFNNYTYIYDSIGGNPVYNVSTYSNYIINNMSFTSVLKVHRAIDPTCGKQPENHYIADHVGIIRREFLTTHHAWNLIRYHIVQ